MVNIIDKDTANHIMREESFVCLTACLLITASSVISLFNHTIRSFITLPLKLDTLFIYGIFLLIVLFSIKKILSRSTLLIYGIIYFLLLAYLIAFMLNTNDYYQYYIDLGVSFLFEAAPWLLVGFAVRDYKIFKKYLYISAIIVLVSFIMNFLVLRINIFGDYSYSQGYAYVLLPVVIILADKLFGKMGIFNIVAFVFSIMLMFSLGARGPMVCLALYIILKIALMYKYSFMKTILYNSLLVFLLVFILTCYNDILLYLHDLFQKMNLSVRAIASLMEGNFFKDNARNLLAKYSIDLIKNNPLTGVGIGYDRILLADKMSSTYLISEVVGWYPHNIFLELLLHFGLFIGGAIILLIAKIVYVSTIKNNSTDSIDVICIFMGIGFFPLLLSGSYFESSSFFMFIGLCLYQYKSYKLNKRQRTFK